MKKLLAIAGLLIAMPLAAHVGYPNTIFEGNAGPYPIRVIVRTPGVIPGLAEISVRSADPGITRVLVTPVKWDAGSAGAPPPDEAKPVSGDRTLFSANLWLMARGSYSVYVDVAGTKGEGRAIVPLTNVATTRLPMPRGLAVLLIGLSTIMAAGAVSIIATGAREAVVAPGVAPSATDRRRGRITAVIALSIVLLFVWRGNAWWSAVDSEYRTWLFKPPRVVTTIHNGVLDLRIDVSESRDGPRWAPVMPDHGKLMHLFLINETKTAFAHVHPLIVQSDEFRAQLPPLPPGRYRLFADVTHESGFAQTLLDRIVVPAIASAPPTDVDDSWSTQGDARQAFITRGTLRANRDVNLKFAVRGGSAEPYMGMLGHAVVLADDFSVFAHLHPMGSISMASQQKFAERDRQRGMVASHEMAMSPPNVLTFPCVFPKPGRYRVWAQTRMHGEVVTGIADVKVI